MSLIAFIAAWKFLAVNFLDNDRTPACDSFIIHVEDAFPRDASSIFASSTDIFAESSRPEHGAHFGADDEHNDIVMSMNGNFPISQFSYDFVDNRVRLLASAKRMVDCVMLFAVSSNPSLNLFWRKRVFF